MNKEWSRSYNGWSGVDITAYISTTPRQKYAKVQAISMSETREMAPIFPTKEPPKIGYAGCLIFREFYSPEPVSIFEVEILQADEDGRLANMHIIGMEIWEEGLAWDMNKMFELDTQYTYIAVDILPWRYSDGKKFKTEERVQEKCF